jgi:hypothetical protein
MASAGGRKVHRKNEFAREKFAKISSRNSVEPCSGRIGKPGTSVPGRREREA